MKTILSIPPSVNHMYGRTRFGKTYKTIKGKDWQEEAAWELKISAKGEKTPFDRIGVTMEVFFPDNRKRDIDNLLKLTGDAIQESGIIKNDSDIMEWRVCKMEPDKLRPRIEVEIRGQ